MSEKDLHWDDIPEKLPKVFLCADSYEKKSWSLHLTVRMRDFGPEKGLFIQKKNSTSENIWVFDDTLKHGYLVSLVTVNQWTWKNVLRGSKVNELVFSRGALSMVGKFEEDVDEFKSFTNSLVRDKTGDVLKDNSLFLMLSEFSETSARSMSPHNYGYGQSLSKDFDFPLSLFRRTMVSYFEDILNPTPEEFIFALTMEGISGNTEWEKASIEKAKLLIEGKGY